MIAASNLASVRPSDLGGFLGLEDVVGVRAAEEGTLSWDARHELEPQRIWVHPRCEDCFLCIRL